MAKVHEEILIVKVSKLVKGNEPVVSILSSEIVENAEAVFGELIDDDKAVVEVTLGSDLDE